MANIFPGYRGYAAIDGIGNVRFGSANISVKQEVSAPDMIMGDWDHDAWNFGPITVGGSISGPVTETFANSSGLWGWAVKRTKPCGELSSKSMTLYYYCGSGGGTNARQFTGMLCNSLNFSCAAGDVANFSLDVMGSGAGSWQSVTPPQITTAEKLITWDTVNVVASGPGVPTGTLNYSNFDFTVANGLTPQYSLGQANLFPYEIVPGLRTITGSLSIYNVPQANGADTWGSYTASQVSTLSFNIGSLSVSFKVRFHRSEPASSVGPMISTVNFTGVTSQTSLDA